jgi:quercetin dioxygenase-like cupin family protein
MQSWNLNTRHKHHRKGTLQLLSTPAMRVDLVDLAQDEEIGDSWYGDRALIQVLSGTVEITIGDYTTTTCDEGTLVALDPDDAHSIRALEQSRLLLTFASRSRGHSPGSGWGLP